VLIAVTGSVAPGLRTGGARAASDPVIVAVGDLACSPHDPHFNGGKGTATACRSASTAALAAAQSPVAVLPLGDEQYYCGLLPDFNASYAKSWGQFNSIADPVPGNHEYGRAADKGGCAHSHAEGYFSYFGSRAGPAGKGYYSYDIGAWHLIALNSECPVVSCAAGSAQETWLKHDLATHTNTCTLAYWHQPLFSSATGTQEIAMAPIWRDLYAAHVDLVLNGHAHNYERFAPQTPTGSPSANGIREIIVGTGGVDHGGFTSVRRNSEVRNSGTYGVLELTLHSDSYSWQFLHIPGASFSDSGTTACH
jgi:hypothetical protein